MDEDAAVDFALAELDVRDEGQSAPDETAAFVIEPVLGEGGYLPAPRRFLEGLRERADATAPCSSSTRSSPASGAAGASGRSTIGGATARGAARRPHHGQGPRLGPADLGRRREAATMARWERGTHGGTYGGGSRCRSPPRSRPATSSVEERLPENAAARGRACPSAWRDLQALTRDRRRARSRA
jgi:4-aminobutyrate aminotransferase